MPTTKEMKNWNYKKAWTYFIAQQNVQTSEAYQYLQTIAKRCEVRDLRDSAGIPEEIFTGNWLILMDGASCSGKSTISKKIKTQFPETVEVVDIDLVCMDWFNKQKEKCRNPFEEFELLMTFDSRTTDFLRDELENLVRKASNGGKKTVILVGSFLEIIYRALIGVTIGRHFKKVAFFTVHEEWPEIMRHQKSRELEFGREGSMMEIQKIMKEFQFVEQVLKIQRFFLGAGCDVSYIINSETKLF